MRRLFITLATLIAVLGLMVASAVPVMAATSVGPNNAGTGASVLHTSGNVDWTDPGYITADDTNYATAALDESGLDSYSNWIRGTNYGFSIPGEPPFSEFKSPS